MCSLYFFPPKAAGLLSKKQGKEKDAEKNAQERAA
jgi:hypothetical protein